MNLFKPPSDEEIKQRRQKRHKAIAAKQKTCSHAWTKWADSTVTREFICHKCNLIQVYLVRQRTKK